MAKMVKVLKVLKVLNFSGAERAPSSGSQSPVRLSLTDDVYLRSYNWARWQLGIPLPPPER
jgi:hypothetical protein